VIAGQEIATVAQMDNSAMCHFETYALGTKNNHRWYWKAAPPKELRNPML